jgi:FKBP-type peptidyl-prolyl cis-trans isomerase
MRRLRVGLRIGLVFAAGVLWAVASVGCTDTPASPTPTPAFSQTDLIVGTGATAASGASLTVDYTGWLYDPTKPDSKGLQFDTSIGQTPLTFTLGAGQVIQGWEVGVAGMLVGGKRRLIIPPNLAYGDTRKGIVPANATLVFDITLLGSQ